jgi:hypothetical protein
MAPFSEAINAVSERKLAALAEVAAIKTTQRNCKARDRFDLIGFSKVKCQDFE